MAASTGLTARQIHDLTEMLEEDYMGLVAVIQSDWNTALFNAEMMTSAKKVVMMMSKVGMSQEQVAAYLRTAHLGGLADAAGLVTQGLAPQEAPATTITKREAGQLAKAMSSAPLNGFKNALCLLIQGDPPQDPAQGPLEFKRLSQHGWILGPAQLFNAVWAHKVDRRMVREALSILGYSGVADAVLGHDDAYMQDNESAHGSSSSPAAPATVADRDAVEVHLTAPAPAQALAPAPAMAPPPSLRDTLQGLADDDVEATYEDEQCCICMVNKRRLALAPCGHVLCVGCTKEMESRSALACPQCRRVVEGVLPLHL